MHILKSASGFFCDKKPQIDYPCRWSYKVIGKDSESIKRAIISSCKGIPVEISPSHSSSQSTYLSLTAELTIENEEIRLSIYQALTKHPDVILVL